MSLFSIKIDPLIFSLAIQQTSAMLDGNILIYSIHSEVVDSQVYPKSMRNKF